ncbi:SAF domain-containing protein [Streptomyces sp. NPDC059718]
MVRQRRRRPGLIALSVALIAAGGLSGAVLYSSSGHRTPVVVVARDVPVGTRITEADLATASIALDPAVRSVNASRAGGLVGQRAATDLKAGSLLALSQVTDQSLIGAGEQLVGVSVKPSQLPATPLVPGERVLIVSTPDPNATPGRNATNSDGPTAIRRVPPRHRKRHPLQRPQHRPRSHRRTGRRRCRRPRPRRRSPRARPRPRYRTGLLDTHVRHTPAQTPNRPSRHGPGRPPRLRHLPPRRRPLPRRRPPQPSPRQGALTPRQIPAWSGRSC